MRRAEEVERTILCWKVDGKAGQRKVVSEKEGQLELKTFSSASREAMNISALIRH